jgi:hypothetical protein
MTWAYGVDRWCFPFEVATGENVLIFTEGGTDYTLTLNAGTYYWFDEIAGIPSGGTAYQGIFKQIRDQLGLAGVSNTYSFALETPTVSTAQTGATVKLVRDSGTADFAWKFSSASFSFDPRILGFDEDESTDKSNSGTDLVGERQAWGMWMTPEVLVQRKASTKRADYRRELRISSDDVWNAYQLEWRSRKHRRVEYPWVSSAHVYADRAEDAAYASTGRVTTDDDHNAFYDLWSAASRLNDIIVIWDDGNTTMNPLSATNYELVRFGTSEQRSNFRSCLSDKRRNGEFYDIGFDIIVSPDTEDTYRY